MTAPHYPQVQPDETLARLLAETPVFSCLNDAERSRVARSAALRRFDKGATIAGHGELWPHVLLVARGSLRMVKMSDSGRLLAAVTLGPGEVFFSHTLFDGRPLPAALEAETASDVYLWDGPALVRLVKGNPDALWEVSRSLVRQVRRAGGVIESLAFQPLTGRLARLLLDRYGSAAPEPAPRSMTLDDMAARIGTTREVVCRLLYRFADEGLVSITRTELNLLDRGRLRVLAGDGDASHKP